MSGTWSNLLTRVVLLVVREHHHAGDAQVEPLAIAVWPFVTHRAHRRQHVDALQRRRAAATSASVVLTEDHDVNIAARCAVAIAMTAQPRRAITERFDTHASSNRRVDPPASVQRRDVPP
jgi:hypothetical protein